VLVEYPPEPRFDSTDKRRSQGALCIRLRPSPQLLLAKEERKLRYSTRGVSYQVCFAFATVHEIVGLLQREHVLNVSG
jgi:hypothetical protein